MKKILLNWFLFYSIGILHSQNIEVKFIIKVNPSFEMPTSDISISVNGDTTFLGNVIGEAIEREDIVEENLIAACGGWWAGGGDYFYAATSTNGIIIYQGWVEEGQEDIGYHWKRFKEISLFDPFPNMQPSLGFSSTNPNYNTHDFLNKYYFEQIPLMNNSFSMVLTKLIYGNVVSSADSYYNDNTYKGIVINIPEILDPNMLTYWGVKPNLETQNKKFNDLVFANDVDLLNSKLPKIEILKNKLLTINYFDGTEESFLYNIKKIEANNNQYGIMQIELANDEVTENGRNYTARDIIWRLFILDNECYIALNYSQLNRIGLTILSSGELKYLTKDYDYEKGITSGEGIYLSRNKDSYMESSDYINPNELIYLFKLK